jgi:hypothetical protein
MPSGRELKNQKTASLKDFFNFFSFLKKTWPPACGRYVEYPEENG